MGEQTLSLSLKKQNRWAGRPLVKMSANCAEVGRYLRVISLLVTFSRIKWKSTSMCLVLAWKTGLDAKASAPEFHTTESGKKEEGDVIL
jgi:hypothetical protein